MFTAQIIVRCCFAAPATFDFKLDMSSDTHTKKCCDDLSHGSALAKGSTKHTEGVVLNGTVYLQHRLDAEGHLLYQLDALLLACG